MQKVRYLLAILLLGTLLAPTISTAEECNKYSLCGELKFDFMSRYVCNSGVVAYRRPLAQGSYMLSLDPIGIYGQFWWSMDYGKNDGNLLGREIDYIIGIERKIWKLKVDASYSYYRLFGAKGNLHALRAEISWPNKIITPFVHLEMDLQASKDSPERGVTWRPGVLRKFKLAENLVLMGAISLAGHDGIYGFRPEPLSSVRFGAEVSWSLWKDFSVGPQIFYQKRTGFHPSNGGLSRDVLWAGWSLTWNHQLLAF